MLTAYKLVLCLFSTLISVAAFGITTQTQEWVRLRDGTRLMTFVYVAQGEARPVVILRTPYASTDGKINSAVLDGTSQYFLERGYNFVVQAVRGTPPSEGLYAMFNPQEIEDARDTLDWISAQRFCNGRIAAVGTSYDGYTALASAVTNHPHLKVVFAGGSPSGIGLHTFQSQGLVGTQLLDYARYNYLQFGRAYDPTITQKLMLPAIFNEPDPTKYDDILYGKDISDWNEMARQFNKPDARIWTERSIRNRLPEIQVPTFHIAGSKKDADNKDVISNFKFVNEHSAFKNQHRLIVGPWDHGNSTPYLNGSNLSPFMAKRFDSLLAHYMKDIRSPFLDQGRVQWELSPGGQVLGSSDFPIQNTVEETIYLQGNSLAGHSALSSGPAATRYQYLPMLPTTGREEEAASFVYKVEDQVTLVGELKTHLFVRSDRPVTDVILFTEVERVSGDKDALAYCLIGGKIFGENQIQELKSGDCPINARLFPGDKVKITITSKFYPLFFRASEVDEKGNQTFKNGLVEVLHSNTRPSSLSWPRLIESGK